MPKMTVKRTVSIHASQEKIFNVLSDFNQWQAWSPWLIMEPGVKVTVRDDSKYYEWEGKRTGSGNMTIINENGHDSIDYDLVFLKPWKSHAKVSFILSANGDSTYVTWTMDSSLPFFMFWMKKSMEAFVGMDYERGLSMLKEHVETGEILSKLDFRGESNFEGTKYVGIKTKCDFDKMGEHMMSDFGKLDSFMQENQEIATGIAHSIYHKWDPVKREVEYTAAVGVKDAPASLSEGIHVGEIPATKVYTLRHVGRYEHMGNAWSTLYSMHRGKEFKPKKNIHPFETYMNNPKEVEPKDYMTDVSFAIN